MKRVSRYQVELTRRAQKGLESAPVEVRRRIVRAIDALAETPRPHGAKRLAIDEDIHRPRVGDWRILYAVQDKVLLVLVVSIGHRREAYRRIR